MSSPKNNQIDESIDRSIADKIALHTNISRWLAEHHQYIFSNSPQDAHYATMVPSSNIQKNPTIHYFRKRQDLIKFLKDHQSSAYISRNINHLLLMY